MSKKILVIEDDLSFRKSLYDALGHEYSFITADDGEQGIEKVLVHKPDLIILDLLLPKLDGFEVLKRIREYPEADIKDIPIIILSNLSDNEDFIKAQNYKIEHYYVKAHTKLLEVKDKVRRILFKEAAAPQDEVADFRDMV